MKTLPNEADCWRFQKRQNAFAGNSVFALGAVIAGALQRRLPSVNGALGSLGS